TAACYQEVTPQHAENPVGTTHTITSTMRQIIDGNPGVGDAMVSFEVIDGPNKGAHSDNDCEPNPDCVVTDFDEPVSWTYRSNGEPGLDTILVCTLEIGVTLEQTLLDLEFYLRQSQGEDLNTLAEF